MVGTKFDKHTSSLPNDMHDYACMFVEFQKGPIFVRLCWLTRNPGFFRLCPVAGNQIFPPPTATGGLGGGGGGGAVLREALEPPDVVSGERLPETL